MSHFFKNTKKLSIMLSALLLVITLTAGTFAVVTNGMPNAKVAENVELVAADVDSIDLDAEPVDEPIVPRKQLDVQPLSFNAPTNMNGVYLVGGSDFLKKKGADEATFKAEIDTAVKNVKTTGANSVIIDTVYGDKVIYQTTDANKVSAEFDIMNIIIEKCRENGLFVYSLFDVAAYIDETGNMDKLTQNVTEFVQKYKLDGILVDGYEIEAKAGSYSAYMKDGGAMGYENYLRRIPADAVKSVAKAVRKSAQDTQIGLLAGAVWANKADNELGSETTAKHTSLNSGFADTKSYIDHKWFDFVAVKAYTKLDDTSVPFLEVANWWGKLASANNLPMYIVHDSNKVGVNYTAQEMQKQTTAAAEVEGYSGSIYNLLKNAPNYVNQAALNVVSVASKPVAEVAKPAETKIPDTALASATKPSKTTSDEEYAEIDVEEDTETTASSDKQILTDISPMGLITGVAEDTLEITATALKDAKVTASINGKNVSMALDDTSIDGKYGIFYGYYTVPSSDDYDDDEEQVLGGVSITATLGGNEETMDGAYLKVAAKPASTKKTPIRIIADHARTYPKNTKDSVPIPTMYPYPKGATDYAVGERFQVPDDDGDMHEHVMLDSGVRIETTDIEEIEEDGPKDNSITGLTASSKTDGNTYITLKTKQKVTFSVAYTPTEFIIWFNHTTKIPDTASIKSNSMFSKATWSDDNKLTLKLKRAGGFMGYKAYYDGDNLVFRFNNPPSSIKTAKIAIDPGHGGKDVGAVGSDPAYTEAVINAAIAKRLAEELKDRGATVKVLNSANKRGPARAVLAEDWGADILISVHCNTAKNTAAKGTESYYFYPFSKQLATNSAANVSRQAKTVNRGAKLSYYHVTLSTEMLSVLTECGFMTNKSEFSKLIKASTQEKIAVGIANGIEGAIKTAYTGKVSNGSEFSGDTTPKQIEEEDVQDDSETDSGLITSLSFSDSEQTVGLGQALHLEPNYEPENLDKPNYTWRTSNSAVATVDENGKVVGMKEGKTVITAMADDGSHKRASITITVTSDNIATTDSSEVEEGIALKSAKNPQVYTDYLTVYPGNKAKVDIASENGTLIRGGDFTWRTNKSSVATVDSKGIVTGKAVGTCTVSATSGSYKFECQVEVSRTRIPVAGISIDKQSITVVRKLTGKIQATISPQNATDSKPTWSSANERIATVDSNGIVTGVNMGKTTITAKTKTGGFKAICEVEVVKAPVPIDSIELYSDTLEMRIGDTDIAYYNVSPSNVTDSRVTYASSNPKIVSVDAQGNIAALAKGHVKITVTSVADRKVTAECDITVY